MGSCPEHLAQSASIHSEQVDHTNRGCSLHQLSSYLSQLKLSGMLKLKFFKRILYLGCNYKIFWDFFYDVQRVTKNVCDIYGYTKMETSVSIRTLKLDTLGHG